MIKKENEKELEILKELTLFDDAFFTEVFDNSPECLEVILQIILDDKNIKVIECMTQKDEVNILHRSVRFDILAKDERGRVFNVEIQKAKSGILNKRARFYSSVLDSSLLKKGDGFKAIPESYVIFINEKDVFKKGIALYKVERYVKYREEIEKFNDGSYIMYVNGEYKGRDSVGRLIHDLKCSKAEEIYIKELRDKVKYYKEEDEGIKVMSDTLQRYKKEWVNEGITIGKTEGIEIGKTEGIAIGKTEIRIEMAKKMISSRALSVEEISNYTGLSIKEINDLLNKGH